MPPFKLPTISFKGGAIIIGALFSQNVQRSKENLQLKERIGDVEHVAAGLAHEIRTPLASVNLQATNLELLITKSFKSKKDVPASSKKIPSVLGPVLKDLKLMRSEIKSAATFVGMMLMNLKPERASSTFSICSMAFCINEALRRYPFQPKQVNKIIWKDDKDFKFRGDNDFMIHVFFNLIKNALYYLAEKSADQGKVFISIENRRLW